MSNQGIDISQLLKEIEELAKPYEAEVEGFYLGLVEYKRRRDGSTFVKVELGDPTFQRGAIISAFPPEPNWNPGFQFGTPVRARLVIDGDFARLVEVEKLGEPSYTTLSNLAEIARTNRVTTNALGKTFEGYKAAGIVYLVLRFTGEDDYGFSVTIYPVVGGKVVAEEKRSARMRKSAVARLAERYEALGEIMRLKDYDPATYLDELRKVVVVGPAYVVASIKNDRVYFDVKRVKPDKIVTLDEVQGSQGGQGVEG